MVLLVEYRMARTTRTPVFWGYPRLPTITHTIVQFISDLKSKQAKESSCYKFQEFAKTLNFELKNVIRDTPSEFAW